MIGGTMHRITLTTSTPGSGYFIDVDYFLTNLPPYGGSCSIAPTEGFILHYISIQNFSLPGHTGYSAFTNFSVVCENWEEWRGTGQGVLKYEYRVQQYGAKRSLLFYYGHDPGSTPSMYPVGNHEMEFLCEVILLVYDPIGDYFLLKQNVTVC